MKGGVAFGSKCCDPQGEGVTFQESITYSTVLKRKSLGYALGNYVSIVVYPHIRRAVGNDAIMNNTRAVSTSRT